MELLLQQGLPHQQKAIDAVCDALDGVAITPPVQFYENPQIDLADRRLSANLHNLQKDIPAEYRSATPVGACLNLDIKMETGTGKTYVYTKTIYELHQRYGLNKFIVAVPSLAIKAGTAQFMQDDYARRHFTDGCGYDAEIELGVLEAPKNKKRGRSYFPSVVSDFIKGSCQNTKKIYVLLVNMQLLTSNSKRGGRDTGLLWRDDYDYGVEGFYRPFDALRATRPVVMIDEPHRFSREQKAFQAIMDELQPQCVIRYGATFPETTTGRGKNKVTVKDYQNLLYDLNACESFHQGLIKGVAKEHFEPLSKLEEKVKILSVASKDSVTLQRKKRNESAKSFTLKTGDSLAIVSDAFEGITITAITANTVEFSNGVSKTAGEEMDVDVYMSSYQEQIEHTLSTLNEHETEYRSYLEASLADIPACHAGYFSQDNSDSDEEIAKEVDAILNGKKQLLSFRKADGTYNTLRFLFSKWTLKEGWDNPNVFTIAKLHSSGSENSNLQEVGRGLRLPVDEHGNRISNEEFQLNYIVDFTEADFAQRLVDQINDELPQASALDDERIKQAAEKLGIDPGVLFGELLKKQYIDWQRNIVSENRAVFFAEYPMFASGLPEGKIKDRNKDKPKPIKIRKAVYAEIQEFWEKINQRYLLFYDSNLDENMTEVALSLFEKPGVFTDAVITSKRDIVHSDGIQMGTTTGTGVQYTIMHPIPYGAFLARIMRVTNIPIAVLHDAMAAYCEKHGTVDAKYINENSVQAFCAEFQNWKVEHLLKHFYYHKSSTPCGATALTYADGTPREEIAQGRIGTKIVPGTPGSKYLYDAFAYDSPLEKENITADIEDVVAYGKIPRNSIAIPTITGSMYSPDFIYAAKKASNEKTHNIVTETKDVESKDVLRSIEKAKIACAQVFFETLSQDGDTIHFRDQLNHEPMKQIINEVLHEEEYNQLSETDQA